MNYQVLYNPHAGNERGLKGTQKLRQHLPGDVLVHTDITTIDDYAAFFAALPAEDRILISGGDGTLNRFINDTAGLDIRQISEGVMHELFRALAMRFEFTL